MATLYRWVLAVFAGLAVSIVLAEAAMTLHQLLGAPQPLLARLASGQPFGPSAQAGLMAIWLLAALPGGAMAAALGRLVGLGLLVGLGCGAVLAFSALVGGHPDSIALGLGLVPVLGALIGMRIAQHLKTLDRKASADAGAARPGL